MNVAFFLTPKAEVVWVPAASTLSDVMERVLASGFSALPALDDDGRYVGALTEGAMLRVLLHPARSWAEVADWTRVGAILDREGHIAVHIDAPFGDVAERAIVQRFVPVVDDRDVFVGIVRRSPILAYWGRLLGVLGTIRP